MNGRLVIFALCITLLTSPLIWGMEETAVDAQLEAPKTVEQTDHEKYSLPRTSSELLEKEYLRKPHSLRFCAAIAALEYIYGQIKQKKHQKFLEDQAEIALEDKRFSGPFELHIAIHGIKVSDHGGKTVVFLAHMKTLNLAHAIMRGIYKVPDELISYIRAVHLLKNTNTPSYKDCYCCVLGDDTILQLEPSLISSPFS